MSTAKDPRAHVGYDAKPEGDFTVAHPLRHLTAWARDRIETPAVKASQVAFRPLDSRPWAAPAVMQWKGKAIASYDGATLTYTTEDGERVGAEVIDRTFTNCLKSTYTSEEDTMNTEHDFQSGGYGCAPVPESATTTLKRLRREAMRIRKEIAAVKKADKRNRELAALAVAQAKQQEADREFALAALRHVAGERITSIVPAADRIAAATALIDYTGGI